MRAAGLEYRHAMASSRRQFLKGPVLGVIGVAAVGHVARAADPPPAPAGSPPAFGTGPLVGPEIGPATIAEAEKLAQVRYTAAQRTQGAASWRAALASLYERRTGPRKVALADSVAPASQWNPALPGLTIGPTRNRFVRTPGAAARLPARDEDIAFAPVTQLARWIETRQLSSDRLTRLYLDRLERFQPRINCVITLTRDLALAQAKQADAEIAAGKYRGPLHGIPWGAKDLVDTAGITTTYGAEPFQHRVPAVDAVTVARLHRAGAVLVAKLSLGALALNDIWYGGQTNNPWLLVEGASGSSAGPGAATAAGCVGFALGSETGGSIISPAMRCGVTGLRPTFGRVPRTGAMTLCWSLDKLGPMARGVEDTFLVLSALTGPDPGDVSSVPSKLDFDAGAGIKGLKVGFFPRWMAEPPATEVDRAALAALQKLGAVPVEVQLPDWPYQSLMTILFAEAAASFEELTLGHGADQFKM
jgi:amidase